MNSYTFKLQMGNTTRETPVIRATDLQAAEEEIESDIEEGWSIIERRENGKLR